MHDINKVNNIRKNGTYAFVTQEPYQNNLNSSSDPFFDLSSFNDTSGTNATELSPKSAEDESWEIFDTPFALWLLKATALSLLILLTVLGNLLVIVGVASSSRLRTPSYFLIVNLAVADLLLGVAVLPISAARELFDYRLSPLLCVLWSSLDVLCCTASILSLCALAGERYLGVSRPLRRARVLGGPRARVALLAAPWAAAALIALAAPLAWPHTHQASCGVNKHLGYVIFSACGSFYIPAIAMLILWWRVYKAAVRRSVRLAGGRLPEGPGLLRAHRGGSKQIQNSKDESFKTVAKPMERSSSEAPEITIEMSHVSRKRIPCESKDAKTQPKCSNDSRCSECMSLTSANIKCNTCGAECLLNSESEVAPTKARLIQMNKEDHHYEQDKPKDLQITYNCFKKKQYNINATKKRKDNQNRKTETRNKSSNITGFEEIRKELDDEKDYSKEQKYSEAIKTTRNDCGFKHKVIYTSKNESRLIHVVKCSSNCKTCSGGSQNASSVSKRNLCNCSLQHGGKSVLERTDSTVVSDDTTLSKSCKFEKKKTRCISQIQNCVRKSSNYTNKRLSWTFRQQSASIRSEQSSQGRFGGQSRAARTMMLVVGGFLLCWCPFFIILPIDAACESCNVGTIFTLAFWLGYFNSCINPFIYACSSREMRRAFISILCRRKSTAR